MNFDSIHKQFSDRNPPDTRHSPGTTPLSSSRRMTARAAHSPPHALSQFDRPVASDHVPPVLLACILALLPGVTFESPAAASGKDQGSSADGPESSTAAEPAFTASERNHWSFRPIASPPVPVFTEAADRNWTRTPVDAFILAGLQASGLKPARQADRRTLMRRLYFNLTGLPPVPEDIAAFLEDDSPDAWERLIDKVLSSPHYGEKWGQHWLDVVRFAESEGFEYDRHHAAAWRFRDYVVRSFNADRPFNRFVTEQLAGDELAAESLETDPLSSATLRDQIVAAGFHRLGPVRRNAGNPEIAFSRNEVLTEMTNAVGTVFLGLTVGCARCHDHFFDPFRQTDYYRLQAFLAATNEFDAPFVDQQVWSSRTSARAVIEKQIASLKEESANARPDRAAEIKQQITELTQTLPPPAPTLFSVRHDEAKRTPVRLLTRGDDTLPTGRPLGMAYPGILVPDSQSVLAPDTPTPKTRLAGWITSPQNPLTARVIANRVWQYHFGQGLVATPNDFGVNGASPTHPALLDWLARQLIDSGWSLKALHRVILASHVWQQTSQIDLSLTAKAHRVDAHNRLLWKFSRRRLTAEELRDSMLQISGSLNPKFTGVSVITPVPPELIGLLYKPEQWVVTEDTAEHDRRSVYLIAKRNLKLPFMEVFDQPDLLTSCDCRETSTHAPQALELLNGEFSNRMATRFTACLLESRGHSGPHLVRAAFELATGQLPTAAQQEAGLDFLKTQPMRELALAVFNLNAFLYVR
ncbi:MAG: DUF1549 and DUF1553 domain-containing protein [Planctomycetaceae bacterium]